ncbi:hypothetical protein HDV06_005829 [Boothiomyces sp. JEL0866]|nr:hypothetical protein HDV06_005829 [Boothiomyces sp. JEL0866]
MIVEPMISRPPFMGFVLNVLYIFRFTEMLFLPKEISRLSYLDYMQFLSSFTTKDEYMELVNISKSSQDMLENNAIPFKDQNAYYYGKTLRTLAIKYLIYRQLQLYIDTTHWFPEPYQTTGLQFLCDVYLLGILLSLLLDIFATILLHITANLFRIPIVPLMNLPYLSTSARDFWSRRWNLIVGNCLRRGVFVPILIMMGYRKQVAEGKPIPFGLIAFASLGTFLASALLHEWILFIVLDKPSSFEQFNFFMLHGLICILEVLVSWFAKLNGVDFAQFPWILKVLYTHGIMFITGPLFMNPFFRERTWKIVKLPLIF